MQANCQLENEENHPSPDGNSLGCLLKQHADRLRKKSHNIGIHRNVKEPLQRLLEILHGPYTNEPDQRLLEILHGPYTNEPDQRLLESFHRTPPSI